MTWVWVVPSWPSIPGLEAALAADNVGVFAGSVPPHERLPPAIVLLNGCGEQQANWPQHLDQPRRRFPATPIAVVSPYSRGAAARLGTVEVDHVLWSDDVARICSVVAEALTSSLRTSLTSIVQAACGPDPLVRKGVRLALNHPGEPLAVSSLARSLHASQSALRSHWRDAGPGGTPRELSDWWVVCAIAEAREQGRTIESVSCSIGIDKSTVYRVARRVLDAAPAGVTHELVLPRAAARFRGCGATRRDSGPLTSF